MASCRMRHAPSNDPKFHKAEMLDGVGRSIKVLLMIFNSGFVFFIVGVEVPVVLCVFVG